MAELVPLIDCFLKRVQNSYDVNFLFLGDLFELEVHLLLVEARQFVHNHLEPLNQILVFSQKYLLLYNWLNDLQVVLQSLEGLVILNILVATKNGGYIVQTLFEVSHYSCGYSVEDLLPLIIQMIFRGKNLMNFHLFYDRFELFYNIIPIRVFLPGILVLRDFHDFALDFLCILFEYLYQLASNLATDLLETGAQNRFDLYL